MIASTYTPEDWYWIVDGNDAQLWSSKTGGYVAAEDVPEGAGIARIANEVELSDVLRPHRLTLPVVSAQDVKDEARRRILSAYPDWKQANMTARGVELVQKLALGQSWTPAETAEAAALQTVWAWITLVREASDALEAMAPIPIGYLDAAYWPQHP